MSDPQNEEIGQIYQPLGGKEPCYLIPKQIDCEAYRNLLNVFHNEYWRAHEACKAAGDELQAMYMLGITKGLSLAWDKHAELERFGR